MTLLPSIGRAGCGAVDAGIYCQRVRLCGLGGAGGAASVRDGGDDRRYVSVEGIFGDGTEARRFYGLFDASAEGVGSSQLSVVSSQLPTPARFRHRRGRR